MSDDIISRDLKHLFEFHDVHFTGYIDEWQLQKLYGEVRFGGINLSQVCYRPSLFTSIFLIKMAVCKLKIGRSATEEGSKVIYV